MRRLQLIDDGKLLCACGGWSTGPVSAWETTGWTLQGHHLGHISGVNCLSLSPDGVHLATASRDRTLRIWSPPPARPVQRLEAGIDARRLAVDLQHAHFAAASVDGHVTVWDGETLEPELAIKTKDYWLGCALADDRVYVVGRSVKALDRTDGRVLAEGTTNKNRIENMLISPDERWLIGGHGYHVMVWSLPDLDLVHDIERAVGPCHMVWDKRVDNVIIGCSDATIRWLDPQSGTFVRELEVIERADNIGALCLVEGVLAVGAGRSIDIYRDDKFARTIHTRNICGALFPGGRRLVTGAPDNKVRIVDIVTGNIRLVFDDPLYAVGRVHIVGGGKNIIALSHRWEAPTYIYAWHAPDVIELPR